MRIIAAVCLISSFLLSATLTAEEVKPTPLGIRQEGVAGEMTALERKLMRLIQDLKQTEPEQAARLTRAFKAAKAKLIEKRMSEIAGMLNRVKLDVAGEQQHKVIKDLTVILEELLKEDDEYDRLEERIKQLEKWRSMIQKLQKEENAEKRESENVSDKEKALASLAERIEQLKKLRAEQAKLKKNTEKAVKTGDQELDKLAREQEKLRRKTRKLKEDIAKDAAADPEERNTEPGEEALSEATKHQKGAEKKLSSGKPKSSSAKQKDALKKMDEALASLQKEKDRLEKLPKDHHQKMAEEQDKTADKTDKLAKEMESAESESEPSPGKQNVSNAKESMSKASQSLQKSQSSKATPKQKDALEELKKAKKELEKKIAELRKKQQDELLAKLQDMFKDMLVRQQKVTLSTISLEKKRAKWTRAEELHCVRLGGKEKGIGDIAAKALEMMEKDGTPTVFPGVTRILKQDIDVVQKKLEASATGEYTQAKEKAIEQTLKDLIAALDEAQDNPPPQEPKESKDGEGKPKKPPLVSILAELKLLRTLQLRTNKRTVKLDGKRDMAAADFTGESRSISAQQKETHRMLDELISKAEKSRKR